jgi:hypothetical protein
MTWDNHTPNPEHAKLIGRRVVTREFPHSPEVVGIAVALDYRPQLFVDVTTGRRIVSPVEYARLLEDVYPQVTNPMAYGAGGSVDKAVQLRLQYDAQGTAGAASVWLDAENALSMQQYMAYQREYQRRREMGR